VEGTAGPGGRRDEVGKAPDRKGPTPPRPRGEGPSPASGGGSRPGPEPRRKRGNEPRYVGFGDGVERAFCIRDEHFLPLTFPVESHAGAATIRATIVARRADALLLCNFSHGGEHIWPDGEVVPDPADD
jgi:hypothetical protein